MSTDFGNIRTEKGLVRMNSISSIHILNIFTESYKSMWQLYRIEAPLLKCRINPAHSQSYPLRFLSEVSKRANLHYAYIPTLSFSLPPPLNCKRKDMLMFRNSLLFLVLLNDKIQNIFVFAHKYQRMRLSSFHLIPFIDFYLFFCTPIRYHFQMNFICKQHITFFNDELLLFPSVALTLIMFIADLLFLKQRTRPRIYLNMLRPY